MKRCVGPVQKGVVVKRWCQCRKENRKVPTGVASVSVFVLVGFSGGGTNCAKAIAESHKATQHTHETLLHKAKASFPAAQTQPVSPKAACWPEPTYFHAANSCRPPPTQYKQHLQIQNASAASRPAPLAQTPSRHTRARNPKASTPTQASPSFVVGILHPTGQSQHNNRGQLAKPSNSA